MLAALRLDVVTGIRCLSAYPGFGCSPKQYDRSWLLYQVTMRDPNRRGRTARIMRGSRRVGPDLRSTVTHELSIALFVLTRLLDMLANILDQKGTSEFYLILGFVFMLITFYLLSVSFKCIKQDFTAAGQVLGEDLIPATNYQIMAYPPVFNYFLFCFREPATAEMVRPSQLTSLIFLRIRKSPGRGGREIRTKLHHNIS